MRGLVAVLVLLVPFAGGSEAARAPVPRGEIFVVGADGRGRQNLTRTAAAESELALSPDGRRIAYVRSEGTRPRAQIWVMNVDGSDQRRLTSGGDGEFWPQWSPDGRRLAYMVWDDSACTPVSGSGCAVPDVWTVDADGSGQRKVLDSAFQPRWSPDGSKLLFQRYDANPDRATLGVYVVKQRRDRRETARSSAALGVRASPSGVVADRADDRLRSRDGRCPPPPSQRRRPQKTVPRRRLVAGVVARRQPDRLRTHKRHLGHPLARRPATPHRGRVGWHASVSGVVALRKAARVQLRQPAVRRPRGRALDETRRAGRHLYVRRLLPSLTAGLVSQRPAPVLLELRSPSGAFLKRERRKGRGLRPAPSLSRETSGLDSPLWRFRRS